jgi:hypothetical protein
MAKMKNKGTLFYTMIGIMVIVLVMVISVHILRVTYKPQAADEKSLAKFSQSIYGLKAEMQDVARYAEYPVIWETGHNVSSQGINVYLTMADGRERLRDDLIKGFAENYNEQLKSISVTNATKYYTLMSNDIPIIVSPIDIEDVTINETDEGFTINYTQHMESKYKTYRYSNNENIKVDVASRIFQMYDRSKAFHENYANDVAWATTIALYTRAYINGYDPTYTGSFLKEGHMAYDPLEQVLSGNVDAVKNFDLDSIDDIGSIPVATWLTEWQYLSEPSFLPPSVEYDLSKGGNAKIVELLKKNYDVNRSTDCESITDSQQRQECIDYNDPGKITAKADLIEAERQKLLALANKIDNWDPSTDDECDDFKVDADDLINKVDDAFDKQNSMDYVVDPAIGYSIETDVEADIRKNSGEVIMLEDAITSLGEIKDNRLSEIDNTKCILSKDVDYKRGKGPEDCDESDDCLKCEDPSYINPPAPSDGTDFTCNKESKDYDRFEWVPCKYTYCEEYDEDGSCSESVTEDTEKKVYIDQGNYFCHPKFSLINATKTELNVVKQKIYDRDSSLLDQENKLRARAQALEEAGKKFKEIRDLSDTASSVNYDVYSKLKYSTVRYFPVTLSSNCYFNPTYLQRENGTCGDKTSSIALYTAQVSAATICCALSGTCCPTIKYASEWFPAIYQVEGNYNITESIIDDKNRIMLHNIFAGDEDLYGMNVTPKLFTHVPSEFVIYQNYTIDIKSKTGDRVFVYLYLPKIAQSTAATGGAINKVIQSFKDLSCSKQIC